MTKIVASRVTAAPLAAVWDVFSHLAARPAWLSDVESVQIVDGADGPFGEGTTWRETRRDRTGRRVTDSLVVVAVEPGHSCTFALADNPASTMTYVFCPVAVGAHRGGTTISVAVLASEPAGTGRPRRIANSLLAFAIGAFAARTAEGALRVELEALAGAALARAGVSRGRGVAA